MICLLVSNYSECHGSVHFKALLSFLDKTNSENTKVSRLFWLAVIWSEVGNHLGEVAWWKFLVCSTLPTQVSRKENFFITIFYDPLKKESLQFSMQMQALFVLHYYKLQTILSLLRRTSNIYPYGLLEHEKPFEKWFLLRSGWNKL